MLNVELGYRLWVFVPNEFFRWSHFVIKLLFFRTNVNPLI
nr:MAG TPA: hypothetical protein [Caudoviricetes sp.]